jgi:hypothetical protein
MVGRRAVTVLHVAILARDLHPHHKIFQSQLMRNICTASRRQLRRARAHASPALYYAIARVLPKASRTLYALQRREHRPAELTRAPDGPHASRILAVRPLRPYGKPHLARQPFPRPSGLNAAR